VIYIEREEWLKSLKEGDKVWNSRQDGYIFYTIKKITPTGKIRLNNDVLLNNDGYGEQGFRFNMTYYKIEPITEKILTDIKIKRERAFAIKELNKTIKDLNFSLLNTEKVKDLNKIIKNFYEEYKTSNKKR
jgi:hypothetical protein